MSEPVLHASGSRGDVLTITAKQLEKLFWVIGSAMYEPIRNDRAQFQTMFHFYGRQAGLDAELVHQFLKCCSLQHTETP